MADTEFTFVTIRMPVAIKEQVQEQAIEAVRTMSAQILHYVIQGLQRDGVPCQPPGSGT